MYSVCVCVCVGHGYVVWVFMRMYESKSKWGEERTRGQARKGRTRGSEPGFGVRIESN